MSVFMDFQRAWATRFPGCKLPKAWEDDVRSNLTKHREKVSQLREELEKEEFYVEYLEVLLSDVEERKKDFETKLENGHSSEKETLDHRSTSTDDIASLIATENVRLNKNDLHLSLNDVRIRPSATLRSCSYIAAVSNDKLCDDNQLSETLNPVQDDQIKPENQINGELPDPYVTVIAVNGLDKKTGENLPESKSSDCDKMSESLVTTPVTNGYVKRKLPPKPPPKRTGKTPSVERIDLIGSLASTPIQSQLPSVCDVSEQNGDIKPTLEDAILDPVTPVKDESHLMDSTFGETRNPFLNESLLLSMNEVGLPLEELSLDSDYVAFNNSEYDNHTLNSHASGYSSNSGHSLFSNSSGSSTSGPVTSSPLFMASFANSPIFMASFCSEKGIAEEAESPKYSDYVNIDFFLKKPFICQDSREEGAEEFSGRRPHEDDRPVDAAVRRLSGGPLGKPGAPPAVPFLERLRDKPEPDSGVYGSSGDSVSSMTNGNSVLSPVNTDNQPEVVQSNVAIKPIVRARPLPPPPIKKRQQSLGLNSPDQNDKHIDLDSLNRRNVQLSESPPDVVPRTDKSSHIISNGNSVRNSITSESSIIPTSFKSDGMCETPIEDAKVDSERNSMRKCIVNSVVDGEKIYLECLNLLVQYMKALKSTIGTSQPVMSKADFESIFFCISELHELHLAFVHALRGGIQQEENYAIGTPFKMLASKLELYASFLQNYPLAIETVRKCSSENTQFFEITKDIKLKSMKGQAMTLEELLHKPVARIQKITMVLQDLLKYTLESNPDYKILKSALKLTQSFLNEYNTSATETMFLPVTAIQDRTQRHLVKNSFIVELHDGHRKLRHLFLFNDVIICAKYKASNREKFTFEVKWYIPLGEATTPCAEKSEPFKEVNPANVLALKTQASTVREQIYNEEQTHRNRDRTRATNRNIDRYRKKLAELESLLLLASPNLVFQLGQRGLGSKNPYTFFLSSEFEKEQWIEAITVLQQSVSIQQPNNQVQLNSVELQAWITSARKYLQTNMGSFLLRSGKDEELLVGDLHVTVQSVEGLNRPGDLFVCLEIDSYGHFFRKAKTRTCEMVIGNTDSVWNQDFVIELEGSQSLRVLVYERISDKANNLRGKSCLEINRNWTTGQSVDKTVDLQDFTLKLTMKYVPIELNQRRINSNKPFGLFGHRIASVAKKEKRLVPYVIGCCVREIEKRGINEVGLYRVSGSTSDMQKLKTKFEQNPYEAEQLLKEVDIHSVTGLLKMYLRELPEALFTDELYSKFLEAFSLNDNESRRTTLLNLFNSLPQVNQTVIMYLIDHMVHINQLEAINKMPLHNLATVFGPTLMRPSSKQDIGNMSDSLASGTIDVMAQAGILYFFLERRQAGLLKQTISKGIAEV